MADQSFIQVRVDDKLKQEATDVLERVGLEMPTAIRMFLKKIVLEGGLPFEAKLSSSVEYRPAAPSLRIPMSEYIDVLCQVPAGKITRSDDINEFLAKKHNVERVEIDYAAMPGNPFWDGIPWWRKVSSRGFLGDIIFHDLKEQKALLEKDGLIIVSGGPYGKSFKVENYQKFLYKDFQ